MKQLVVFIVSVALLNGCGAYDALTPKLAPTEPEAERIDGPVPSIGLNDVSTPKPVTSKPAVEETESQLAGPPQFEQTFRALTGEQRSERWKKFAAANPGFHWESVGVHQFGRIVDGRNLAVTSKPANVTLSPVAVEQVARSFARKNLAFFEMSDDDLQRSTVTIRKESQFRYAWFIRFAGKFSESGYEGIEVLDRSVLLDVFIAADGQISFFRNWGGRGAFGPVTISLRPPIESTDPIVFSQIIGKSLIHQPPHFQSYTDTSPPPEPVSVKTAAVDDLVSSRLNVTSQWEWEPGSQINRQVTLTVVFENVLCAPHPSSGAQICWKFVSAAKDGRLLSGPDEVPPPSR